MLTANLDAVSVIFRLCRLFCREKNDFYSTFFSETKRDENFQSNV